MSIRAVIFDLDGTLIDAQDWHYFALNEALSIFGFEISYDDHVSRFDGLPTRKKLELLSLERGLPEHLWGTISAVKQDRTLRRIASECFPRVEQLLMFEWLRAQGYLLAVATNSIQNTAQTMLEKSGIAQFLELVVTNEDVSRPKPDPEIYALVARRLDLSPSECLVVEDNDFGIESAREAGCSVVEVSSVSEVRTALLEDALTREGGRAP